MLTLEEIENITFRKAGLSGYKIEDVDSFVDKVIDKVRSLELANKELESRIDSQNKDIQKYKEKEEGVQNALITAQITAKRIIDEANEKSEKTVSDAQAEAEKLVREAKERTDKLNAETDAKIEEVMNKALRESSEKIDENNRILDTQKKNIIRIMGEANKFRNSLIQSYKQHLNIINSMSKAEDFKKQQKELDEKFPPAEGNRPIVLSGNDSAASSDNSAEASSETDISSSSSDDLKE